jgi:hypothetical protein
MWKKVTMGIGGIKDGIFMDADAGNEEVPFCWIELSLKIRMSLVNLISGLPMMMLR